MAGFVKLYRQFSNWGWYKNVAVKAVFIELLLSANYEPSEYMGHTVERGQAVFGYASLAERSGVSVQQARTAIKKLQKTGEISVWTNRHFSIATIIKYNDYQQTDNKQITNNQQTDNKQITSSKKERNKEMKKYNNARTRGKKRDSVFSAESASFNLDEYERKDIFGDNG